MFYSRKIIMPIVLSSFIFGLLNQEHVFAAVPEEIGGSNFILIGADLEKLKESGGWNSNERFRTPACQYNLLQTDADQQLQSMEKNNQKKLGLMLWFHHMNRGEDCQGFALNSAGGRFNPQVIINLTNLVKKASALGFNEIQIRFAPMAQNNPETWKEWEQNLYGENWGVISSTIASLSSLTRLHLVYDLSVELGGLHCKGQCEAYARQLWTNYTAKYSLSDSYGFSIAVGRGRVTELLRLFQSCGKTPTQLAVDTYDDRDPGIAMVESEMRASGRVLPILVQETRYDDPIIYRAIIDEARSSGAQIRAVMQWPLGQGAHSNISVSSTPAYIYLPSATSP